MIIVFQNNNLANNDICSYEGNDITGEWSIGVMESWRDETQKHYSNPPALQYSNPIMFLQGLKEEISFGILLLISSTNP